MQLIDWNGNILTDLIGSSKPEQVRWSPDHSSVLVVTNEGGGRRYFVASVRDGGFDEITDRVANALFVEWVSSAPPGGVSAQPIQHAPQLYAPGQQVQVIYVLNLRLNPTNEDENVIGELSQGQQLTILSGPVQAVGYDWYEVELPNGVRGWVAGVINGQPTMQ
jgi:hypothetical protein